MKKILILMILALTIIFPGCSETKEKEVVDTPQDVINLLIRENTEYVPSNKNNADISKQRRSDTAHQGQSPYAVIVTCSDSRVPPEHIFQAGIGDIFVIRTAGNVIGDYELGSVEYGTEHLGAKLVVVLGHTQCGAIESALSGGADGHIKNITDEIISGLPDNCDAEQAERLNVKNSIDKIKRSEIIQDLEEHKKVEVKGAIYNIETGKVEFLD